MIPATYIFLILVLGTSQYILWRTAVSWEMRRKARKYFTNYINETMRMLDKRREPMMHTLGTESVAGSKFFDKFCAYIEVSNEWDFREKKVS